MNPLDYTNLADTLSRVAHDTRPLLPKNRFRNDGKTPYYSHPLAVEIIAVGIAETLKDELMATYPKRTWEEIIHWIRQVSKGHDTVEDTYMSLFEWADANFDPIVVTAIAAITKNPVKGVENYLSYLKRVIAHPIARIVKLADLRHNMSDLGHGNMYDKYVLAVEFLRWK